MEDQERREVVQQPTDAPVDPQSEPVTTDAPPPDTDLDEEE